MDNSRDLIILADPDGKVIVINLSQVTSITETETGANVTFASGMEELAIGKHLSDMLFRYVRNIAWDINELAKQTEGQNL